ncbi:MAG: hypothetical protein INH41_23510 [Myxococcaceae bacterium]|jgi:hypothetical protein|nr:hypothetical protein [Myxococcaceae bacterium]MCA3015367.1 hypothetical protein [Myxococcaceae bacterium]
MKKLFAVTTAVAVVALAGVSFARQPRPVTTDEVNRVIDARLQAMLVKLNHARR